ncbi:MAG TPA: DUF4037 domain-containing protein [Streptosporangiaceae bacterium]|nr:DUF4037 domain-containing protein [Streptosporangiaceae bacterium]
MSQQTVSGTGDTAGGTDDAAGRAAGAPGSALAAPAGGSGGMASVPGGAVVAAYYREVVGPLLGRELPGLRHAAARLGSGSDVLGLDDARSRDHDWGLRLTLLVDEADRAALPAVRDVLAAGLPDSFAGLPARLATTWDPVPGHRVDADTVGGFAASRLGVNPLAGLSTLDWLTLTGQSVLEVTAGPVYADTTTELARLQQILAWYPPDVERYVLACGWQRLVQRLPFVGRAADTGQPLQSVLLSAGLASDLLSLAFLLHRRWEPYEKWREALAAALPGAGRLLPLLQTAATAPGWADREAALAGAAELLAEVQRQRGLPVPDVMVTSFFDRPYRIVSEDLATGLLAQITDPELASLPVRAGSVGQWADCADVLAHPERRPALAAAYRAWRGQG